MFNPKTGTIRFFSYPGKMPLSADAEDQVYAIAVVNLHDAGKLAGNTACAISRSTSRGTGVYPAGRSRLIGSDNGRTRW